MATQKVSPLPFCPQFTITAAEISRYAELTSLISQLEAQQKTLRAELLELRADGAQQEETGPYLLGFTDQERRTVDWKSEALLLANLLYGAEGISAWKLKAEQAAPVQVITAVRVKPNPAFAAAKPVPASTRKPAGSVRSAVPVGTAAQQ
jgi:hypothetical protein